jgi:predicted MPP superfamily phosphohydrolase
MSLLRIAFISDLHLDHNPGLLPLVEKRLDKLKPDVFIIAGDMFSGVSRLSGALKRLGKHVEHLLYLAGNHDLWITETGSSLNSKEMYESILKRKVHLAGSHYLGLEPVYLKGHAILGVTGWYDSYPEPPITTPDSKYCIWPDMETPKDVLKWQLDLLKKQLDEASEKANKIIVVLHTIPFLDLMKKRIPSQLIHYMGSQSLGDLIVQYPKVVYTISGHLHSRYLFSVLPNSMPWEVSPYGYPRELGDDPKEILEQSLRLIEI